MRLFSLLLLVTTATVVIGLADVPEAAPEQSNMQKLHIAPARPLPSSRGNRPPEVLLVSAASVRPTAMPPATPTASPTATAGPRLVELGVFRVTGYSNGPRNGVDGRGITRSGELTRWGVVAVDMAVIPLGTRLMIEGFDATVFTALDTGGGIHGRWLDVFWPSDREAIEWGLQYKTVSRVELK